MSRFARKLFHEKMQIQCNQGSDITLTVIVPTVGFSRQLYSAFASILRSTCPPDEIVVVWNGCKEPDWFECIEERALSYNIPLVKILHMKQLDISASWSSGAEAATSELLYFLGDDDLVDQDFFALAKQCYRENPDIDVFASNARYIDESGASMHRNHISDAHSGIHATKMLVDQDSPWFVVPPPIFASVLRRKKLDSIGFFPYHGFAFDVWMFHHLAMDEGYTLYYVHEPKICYRRSSSSASNQVSNHALSYYEGLRQFQRTFGFAPFRTIAANFAITAILKNRSIPLEAARLIVGVARMGFARDLIKAAFSRAIRNLNRSDKNASASP